MRLTHDYERKPLGDRSQMRCGPSFVHGAQEEVPSGGFRVATSEWRSPNEQPSPRSSESRDVPPYLRACVERKLRQVIVRSQLFAREDTLEGVELDIVMATDAGEEHLEQRHPHAADAEEGTTNDRAKLRRGEWLR
jgi:hypothetical protein